MLESPRQRRLFSLFNEHWAPPHYWLTGIHSNPVADQDIRVRGTLRQSPGSLEAWIEGDGVEESTAITLRFLVERETKRECELYRREVYRKAREAQFLAQHEHGNPVKWRALIGVMALSPEVVNAGSGYWFSLTLAPKFGLSTSKPAWSYDHYESVINEEWR